MEKLPLKLSLRKGKDHTNQGREVRKDIFSRGKL